MGDFWWSLFLAVFVGFAVSLDVCGLLLSQWKDFQPADGRPRGTPNSGGAAPKKIFNQALMHAIWHVSLFLLYMGAVSLLVNIAPNVFEFISNGVVFVFEKFLPLLRQVFKDIHISIPKFDLNLMKGNFVLIVGSVTVMLVWITYKQKLVENHSDKFEDVHNPLKGSRGDIRLIYDVLMGMDSVVKKVFGVDIFKSRLDHALAAAVAVDVLAISALIRVYFEGATDKGTLDKSSHKNDFHFDFIPFSEESFSFLGIDVNILIFSAIMFIVVLSMALVCAFSARYFCRNGPPVSVLILLRVFEPIIVFGMLTFALEHLVVGMDSITIRSAYKIVEHPSAKFVMCLIFLATVFFAAGGTKIFARIYRSVKDGSNIDTSGIILSSDELNMSNVYSLCIKWFVNIFCFFTFCFMFATIFAWSHQVSKSLNSEMAVSLFVGNFAIFIGVLSVMFLYSPFTKIGDFEIYLSKKWAGDVNHLNDYDALSENKPWFLHGRVWVAGAIAYFSMLGYSERLGVNSGKDVSSPVSIPFTGMALLGIFVFFCLWLLNWRISSKRMKNNKLSPDSITSEVLSAIGMVVFLWQLALTWTKGA